MSPFSISKARENFMRLAINAENVAQFVLLRGSRPALVAGTRQHQRQYHRHQSSSELQRRSQHQPSPQAHSSLQLAFQPSFQFNTQSLFNSTHSRAFSSLRRNSISQPLSSSRPRFATTQATTPSYTKPSYTKPSPTTAPDQTSPSTADPKSSQSYGDLTSGLSDEPITLDEGESQVDWARSFHGLSSQPFSKEAAETLMQPISPGDVEVKPDGIIYLPEIKYRRILNKAFGPGGWGLAPRGETIITQRAVTREYALVAHGRLVSVARGEQEYFSADGIPTATEGCKSNALMRCCKDIGVASELWDPRYIRKFMKEHAREVWAEHVVTKKKKKVWTRKDDEVRYPFQAQK